MGRAVDFVCKDEAPIVAITLLSNFDELVKAEDPVGNTFDNLNPGDEVTFRTEGYKKEFDVKVFQAGTATQIGTSTFRIDCKDKDMNDPEDCGKSEGTGGKKDKDSLLLTDWILEGMRGPELELDCTPPGPGDACEYCGLPEYYEVEYTIVVTNNGDPLTSITLTSDVVGEPIAMPFDLAAGVSKTFKITTPISESATFTVKGLLANGSNCVKDDSVSISRVNSC